MTTAASAGGDDSSKDGPLQSVTDTTVFRDLIQIANVAGSVTITQGPPPIAPVGRQIVEGDIPTEPPGFQVREELLEELHARTGAAGAAVISAVTGKPGVGKTMLAASYAWACHQAGWPVVAWISAETRDQIINGLAALAQRLGLYGAEDDSAIAAGRAKAWLSSQSAAGLPGLLVFDNAAQVGEVAAWCPATGALRVLITSRNRGFHQRYAAVEVDTFTPEQALAFLIGRTDRDDPVSATEAAKLATELGRLPLALAQAAALTTRHRGLSFATYRRLLAAFPLQDYLPAGVHDAYPTGTAQAILLSVTAAEDADPEAGRLLRLLAVLSSAGVPCAMLTGGRDLDDPGLPVEEVSEAVDAQQIVFALADTSLISFSEDGTAVVMHRLIQRAIRERAIHDGDLPSAIDHALQLLESYNDQIHPDGVHTWAARTSVEALLVQTDTLLALTTPDLPPRLLGLRSWCGMYLADLAELARAIPLLESTLADRERVLGAEHPDTLTTRSALAGVYGSVADLTRATPLFEATLADRERVLGADHPDTLASRNNLAGAYHAAQDLTRATPLFEATLADRERVLGADHPDTLASRNNLAAACQDVGDLERATSLFEATLADRERVLGADHPHTLISRDNLAYAYYAAQDLTRAIPLFEAVLADRERVLGADHPHTLTSRNNVAGAHRAAGDLGKAISLLSDTLADRERVLGDNHLDTVASRNNLAGAYWESGDLERAIPLLQAIVTDSERILGADHPDTLASRINLAGAYWESGDRRRATSLLKVLLTDCERVLGSNHPLTRTAWANVRGMGGA